MLTPDEARANISANLELLIDGVAVTQSNVARAIKEPAEEIQNARMRVHRYYKGHTLPDAAALARLAEALGVTTDSLLAKPTKRPRKRKAS